jgi:hypothetical protein
LYDLGLAPWYIFLQARPDIKQCQAGVGIPGVKCDEFVKHKEFWVLGSGFWVLGKDFNSKLKIYNL